MSVFNTVNHPLAGTNVIEASAGTGKTFNIQKLVLRLIIEKALTIDKILAVTFTEAATAELREKIRSELSQAMYYLKKKIEEKNGEKKENNKEKLDAVAQLILDKVLKNYDTAKLAHDRLLLAILDFDMASIYTIHGFCSRMLNDCAFESAIPFNTELVTDQTELIAGIIDDFWRKEFYQQPAIIAAAAAYLGIDRKKLQELAKNLMKPGIEPDNKTKNNTSGKLEPLLQKTIANWEKDKNEILDIIKLNVSNNVLSGNKDNFKDVNLTEYALRLDALAENGLSIVSKHDIAVIFIFSETGLSDARTDGSKDKNVPIPKHNFFTLCEDFRKAVSAFSLDLKSDFHTHLISELANRKKTENIQTFDDLLVGLRDALKVNPLLKKTIREKYSAVLIDEFQDTDPVQYEIFNTVFMEDPKKSKTDAPVIFFIGDPKQAIYSFRSADVFTYFNAITSKSITSKNMLDRNFRTQSQLVKDLNILFETKDKSKFNPFVLDEMEYNPVKESPESKGNNRKLMIEGEEASALKICWTKAEKNIGIAVSKKDICRSVAAEITRLMNLSKDKKAFLGNDEIRPSDFAVLARSNREAVMMKDYLEKSKIPAVLQNTGTVFETDEAWQMEIFLRAVADPGNSGLVAAALGSRLFAVDSKLLADTGKDAALRKKMDEWSNKFQKYHHLWSTKSFIRMFRTFLNEKDIFTDGNNVRKRLLKYGDGERTLTNLTHMAELLHEAETSEKLGINGLLNWFMERRMNAEAHKGNEAYLIRLERDEEAVKIVTIHKSKGLEFPIVFCPFTAHSKSKSSEKDFTYHDAELNRLFHFDEDETGDKYKHTKLEDFAEMMRLFYVAVTRAKNLTYLYWGNITNSDYSALGYLFYAPSKSDPVSEDNPASEFDNYFDKLKPELGNNRKFPPGVLETMGKKLKFKVDYPQPTGLPYSYVPENTELDPSEKIFTGHIETKWRVSSFSNLSKYCHEIDFAGDYEDDDDSEKKRYSNYTVPETKGKASAKTFWSLIPKKTAAADLGNCVHEIFEIIDFTSDDAAIGKKILPVLKNYFHKNNALGDQAFAPETLLEPAVAMIRNVLSEKLELQGEIISLKDIAPDTRVSEMEFYYPFDKFSIENVADAFTKYSSNSLLKNEFPAILKADYKFTDLKGYMNGKLDLVFKFNGKYYILDWKTNLIRPHIQSYSLENITRKMVDSHFILQYAIYVKALDKLLKKELKNDYDYDRDFGGVIYLFLRGIGGRLENGKQTGVYFDKPDRRIIAAL
jgi:exodeoxyribonuclease V beta subunit